MTKYLYDKKIRIFDYAQFAESHKTVINKTIEELAKKSGALMEHINKGGVRKESLVSSILEKRGTRPGIVHVISTPEQCVTYKPWHDKTTGRTYLKPDTGKCLHHYVYFIDEQLGLGFVRVCTWCPFQLQVYINGHNLLAREMDMAGIGYTMIDNAFDSLQDPVKAQELSDSMGIEKLHRKLDELAWKCCPVYKELGSRYHWSVAQAEYSTDIVFKKQEYLQSIYPEIMATAIHTVKPDNIATFLGRKLDPRYEGEVGNDYHVRIEGTRIKHSIGPCSIKMYDKFSKILRVETTVNDLSFFKHYREVVHRDGTKSNEVARLKKGIYSLGYLAGTLKSSNRRCIEFISAFDNRLAGRKKLESIGRPVTENNRKYKGFNFFNEDDMTILLAILRGEFNINGFRNKNIKLLLKMNAAKVSRLIKRLRVHGLIKKVASSYKYYLTRLGKETIVMALKIKEMVIIPAFNF
jgi:predicted transcriptional regulator